MQTITKRPAQTSRYARKTAIALTAILGMAAGTAGNTPAMAAEDGALSLGVTGGTLGLGPEIGFRANENFGVRANGGLFSYSHEVSSSGIDYDGDLDLESAGVMADLYPFGGGFRLSGGLRVSNNEVGLEAELQDGTTVNIGNTDFTRDQVGTLSGNVTARDVAPVATIGYSGSLAPGFALGIDLGVMFQGSPEVNDLRSEGGSLSDSSQMQDALDSEAAEIEDDIDEFKYYPVLQISAIYRF